MNMTINVLQGPRAKFDTLHIRTYRVPYISYRLELLPLEPPSSCEDFDISHAQIGHFQLSQEQNVCRGLIFFCAGYF